MQTLSVLAVENGSIVLTSPAGERFRLPVDASLRARLTASATTGEERRLSPREIQSHVRSGLTAEQVAALTGAPVAYIERFVGPVLAELAYIVESGLAVRLPPETEGARSRTFGAVMGERLDALAASAVRWSSAKEPSGWVLAVSFVADEVQHDARWRFDPKHMRLEPDNVEASTLSQQGVPPALTPRLRAIEPTAPVTIVPPAVPAVPAPVAESDRSRFDSAVFHLPLVEEGAARARAEAPQRGAGERGIGGREDARTGRRSDRDPQEPSVDTASLPITRAIEVVDDRRAGEVFAPRPAAEKPAPAPERAAAPVTPFRSRAEHAAERGASAPEPLRRRRDRTRRPEAQPTQEVQPEPTEAGSSTPEADDAVPGRPVRPRRGRTSMPSWDEIVFGRDES